MTDRHRIPVTDTESVVAVHHPAPGSAWFICCHGFVSDKSGSYESRCERAVEAGYNAVRFDFRGCGEADRAFADATLVTRIADLAAVVDHFDPDSYVLFGSSFGAKTAFHAAVEALPTDGLTAIAGRAPVSYNRCFDPARAAVEEHGVADYDGEHTIEPVFFEALDRYPFEAAASELSVPTALFHGTDDGSVPLRDSLDAVAALDGDVLLETFAGEGHSFSRPAEARMRDRLFDWLARQ